MGQLVVCFRCFHDMLTDSFHQFFQNITAPFFFLQTGDLMGAILKKLYDECVDKSCPFCKNHSSCFQRGQIFTIPSPVFLQKTRNLYQRFSDKRENMLYNTRTNKILRKGEPHYGTVQSAKAYCARFYAQGMPFSR